MPVSNTSDADLLRIAIAGELDFAVDDPRVERVAVIAERFLTARPSAISGVWRAPAPDPSHDWLDDAPTPVIAEPMLERLSKE